MGAPSQSQKLPFIEVISAILHCIALILHGKLHLCQKTPFLSAKFRLENSIHCFNAKDQFWSKVQCLLWISLKKSLSWKWQFSNFSYSFLNPNFFFNFLPRISIVFLDDQNIFLSQFQNNFGNKITFPFSYLYSFVSLNSRNGNRLHGCILVGISCW